MHVSLLVALAVVFAWSLWQPRDPLTWVLEAFPVLIAVALLLGTYRRFRFSNLAYAVMWLHALVLLVGAHYTYGEMPLFEWLQAELDLNRNHYDRFAHIAQGFFPAIVVREILLRLSPLKRDRWLFFLVACVCLAISAMYELLEWGVAAASGDAAVAFLATQGDIWDTHWDMLLALIGAVVALLALSRMHDRSMRRLLDGS